MRRVEHRYCPMQLGFTRGPLWEEERYEGLTDRARAMLAPAGKTGYGESAVARLAARRQAAAQARL